MNTYASVSDINNRMISVYNNMFLAVVNSLVVSLLVASSPAAMSLLFGTWLKWVVIFSPLVMIFAKKEEISSLFMTAYMKQKAQNTKK